MPHPLLSVEDVSKTYDGFKAITDLTFYLYEGELRTVIGPNGAGKSTFFDLITGRAKPDKGKLDFGTDPAASYDLTALNEYEINRLGIGRKFQTPSVYAEHTVWDNLVLSLKGPRGVFASLFHRLSSTDCDRLWEILQTVRLDAKRHWKAGLLAHGEKQWLEIGMLLAQDPKLLLVDEPVAGMTDVETETTAQVLREVNKSHSVVVVEHDMSFVRALGCKVTCLHEGSVLAEGTIETVSENPRVIEVYLGR